MYVNVRHHLFLTCETSVMNLYLTLWDRAERVGLGKYKLTCRMMAAFRQEGFEPSTQHFRTQVLHLTLLTSLPNTLNQAHEHGNTLVPCNSSQQITCIDNHRHANKRKAPTPQAFLHLEPFWFLHCYALVRSGPLCALEGALHPNLLLF